MLVEWAACVSQCSARTVARHLGGSRRVPEEDTVAGPGGSLSPDCQKFDMLNDTRAWQTADISATLDERGSTAAT